MQLMDEKANRWYCYKDDETYYANPQGKSPASGTPSAQVSVRTGGTVPKCRICGQQMISMIPRTFLGGEVKNQRWFCRRDGQVYIAESDRWEQLTDVEKRRHRIGEIMARIGLIILIPGLFMAGLNYFQMQSGGYPVFDVWTELPFILIGGIVGMCGRIMTRKTNPIWR